MDHMQEIDRELQASSRQVHDLSAGLRGLAHIAAFALENGNTSELAAYEIEVLATLLADKASQVATKLEPLEFGKRLKADAGADHE